jgi:hypothetical protein
MFVYCFGHILLTVCPINLIFSAAFVTSRGSFLRCWLVCSSPSCRVLALGFELGKYAGCYKRIWFGSHSHPPSGRLPRSFNLKSRRCVCAAIVVTGTVRCRGHCRHLSWGRHRLRWRRYRPLWHRRHLLSGRWCRFADRIGLGSPLWLESRSIAIGIEDLLYFQLGLSHRHDLFFWASFRLARLSGFIFLARTLVVGFRAVALSL